MEGESTSVAAWQALARGRLHPVIEAGVAGTSVVGQSVVETSAIEASAFRENAVGVDAVDENLAGDRAPETASAAAAAEASLEAELLLRHVTGRSRASLYAWPDAALAATELVTLAALLERRLAGEPLAHLIGTREFWSRDFEVGPDVLVPRADTETLVERALELLPSLPPGLIVDAGTGSGAIAVSLALECERDVVATDRHASALHVARRNARRHLTPDRVAFVQGDWLAAFGEGSVALLVSNPPYLAENDPHLPSLSREPRAALVAGEDGLESIRVLAEQASRVLEASGAVLVEHGFSQGEAVRELFAERGFTNVATVRDLAGHERVTEAHVPRSVHAS